MLKPSTSAGNKIWGGNHAAPVLIRCGGAVRRKFRARPGSILCQQPGQLGAAGGVSASPAHSTQFQALSGARSGLVAAACRSTGVGSAETRQSGRPVPLMNNQRRSARSWTGSAAPAGRGGASPLSRSAPAPHAGRARVTSDFRDAASQARPIAACSTGASPAERAEQFKSAAGSGVRGGKPAQVLARKARKAAVLRRNPTETGCGGFHALSNPVPSHDAAPRRG